MIQHIDVSDVVAELFQGLLSRKPALHEADHYRHQLMTGALTLSALTSLIKQSDEFNEGRLAKLFVPAGHFYSPIVDVPAIQERLEAALKRDVGPEHGLDLRHSAMVELWSELNVFHRAAPFPEEKADGFRYYYENPAFSWADALMLHAMLLKFRPRRIIEIGSGFSSACILDTIEFGYLDTQTTFIEPYPDLLYSLMRGQDRECSRVIPTGVQSVDVAVFEELEENDILFIDSTHVSKTGSDVNYEILEILPRLKPGVVVHFHDIFYPFEYPKEWVAEGRSWNEAYILQAFLAFNSQYEILFFNSAFIKENGQLIGGTVPNFLKNPGGSFWMRRST